MRLFRPCGKGPDNLFQHFMKNKILRYFYVCNLLILATTALADNAPLWLDATNTVIAPAGTQVLLRAIADSVPAPQYSWLSNSIPIAGATTKSLIVRASPSTATVQWAIVASNYLGIATNGPYYVEIPTGTQIFYQWGNVTMSGTNSVLDLLKIGDYISGTATATGPSYWLADVNQDGLVNGLDQSIVESAIMGRIALTNVDSLVVSDPYGSGMPNWMRWESGLYQNTASTDGTGIPDSIILANGDDPLDPRNVPPFGYYSASPAVAVLNLTATPTTAGVVLATPPVAILNTTPNSTEFGVFIATPPLAILISK